MNKPIDKKNNEDDFKTTYFKWFVAFAIFSIVLVLFFYFAKFHGPFSNSQTVWGAFGDFVAGLLNPIFSFLALIALLITISIQSEELSLTRKELEKSSDALIKQSESIDLQNFENRFFALINSHKNTASNLRSHAASNKHKADIHGKPCFEVYFDDFHTEFNNPKKKQKIAELDPLEQILYFSKKIIKKYDVEYYFFEHIDILDSLLKEGTKQSLDFGIYGNIVRRQYNKYELFFLYFFHHQYVNDSYQDFLKVSHFFENIDLSIFPNLGADILTIYDLDVFGTLIDSENYIQLFDEFK
jgi:uncharacterized membrane protein